MKRVLNFCVKLLFVGILTSALIPSQARAQVVGDNVTASNTFENPDFTGSAETIFANTAATVADPGLEFPLLAGIYDTDVSNNSLTMTLADNSGLSFTLYTAGTFDRYYYGFDNFDVDSAAIASGDVELTNGLTVGLLAPGYQLNVADLFSTSIPVPISYPNGGFFLEFGEGTDLATLGKSVTVDFTTTPVPEPNTGVLLVFAGVVVLLQRRRS